MWRTGLGPPCTPIGGENGETLSEETADAPLTTCLPLQPLTFKARLAATLLASAAPMASLTMEQRLGCEFRRI